MRIALRTLLLTVSLVAVSACGTTPPARLYTLDADAAESDKVAAEKRRIEIVSVRIPELWDRPQIVLAKPPSEVDLSEFHRWAAPLKAEVPRVVARNLAHLLDDPAVWLREDFSGTAPDLRVQVTIERIEATAGENLRLDAMWMIRAADDGVPRLGRAAVTERLADDSYDAVVAATRRALLAMSIRLAKDVAATSQDAVRR